jgi:chromosome segregation ATPase
MRKRTFRGALLLAAAVAAVIVLANSGNAVSYVKTAWCKVRNAAKEQVSTDFEIDRISMELNSLDQRLDKMIRPVAEHKVAVERLRKEVADSDTRLAEQKKVLLDATAIVQKAKPNQMLCYGKGSFTVEQVKRKIAIDFETFKRFEAAVDSQKKLLESREATLRAAQEQLQTYISKKDEFKQQLAQLKAEHEINKANAVGTSHVEIDETPLAQVSQSLAELKDRIDRQRAEMEMRKGVLEANGIPLNQPQQSNAVDLDAIRAHLENGAPAAKATSTASNK